MFYVNLQRCISFCSIPCCSCISWKIHRRWPRKSSVKFLGWVTWTRISLVVSPPWILLEPSRSPVWPFWLKTLLSWHWNDQPLGRSSKKPKCRWFTFRSCCQCCSYWPQWQKRQVVMSNIQSVWMSRSLCSYALKWATQKTQTLAWQHVHAGVGGVATDATVVTVHIIPKALPALLPALPAQPLAAQPLPSQFANRTEGVLAGTTARRLIFLQM